MFPRITRISRIFFLVIRVIRGDNVSSDHTYLTDFFLVIRVIRGDKVATDYMDAVCQ